MARSARMVLDLALAFSKTLKPMLSTAWQYAKVEVAPPMTVGYLQGPAGQKLEGTVSKVCDGIITRLEDKIKDIDAEEERKIKAKEAAIKAELEKLKAEADRKRKEADMKAQAAKKAAIKSEKKPKEEPKKAEKKEPKKVEKKEPAKKAAKKK